jgi:hypothetical protein
MTKKKYKTFPTNNPEVTRWLWPGLSLICPRIPSVEEIENHTSFVVRSLAPKTKDLSLEELNNRPTIHSDEDNNIVFGYESKP